MGVERVQKVRYHAVKDRVFGVDLIGVVLLHHREHARERADTFVDFRLG
jgi:hypothetical protein